MTKQSFDDEKILNQASHLLNEQADHLDLKTTIALKKARNKALDASPEPRIIAMGETLALEHPGLKNAFIGLLMLMALLFTFMQSNSNKALPNQPPLFADMEILSANESLDFYSELDFYQWLEMNES